MAFEIYQIVLIAAVFIWSGFVRSGLGFGGALFTIPFLLLIHNDPLYFLPIISLHLLFFAALTLMQSRHNEVRMSGSADIDAPRVNWPFVRFALAIMILPKIAGVIGLIVLPADLMNTVIFLMIAAYSVTYILGRPLKSNSRWLDVVFLVIGAYVSGTSLIGGPLVIAVALRHIKISEFRHTLFVLWAVLVSIKLIAFAFAGVPLNVLAALWLLPFAGIGHVIGQRLHETLLHQDTTKFYQVIGWVLLTSAGMGLYQLEL
jgi:hypothetical protein|tara:strand:- start:1511 stop:2290 length:780 start_codon:yes stop_codon:yes gene_type:complete